MKTTVKIAQTNKPNTNGIVYTQECLEKMAKDVEEMNKNIGCIVGEVQRGEVEITNPCIANDALSVDCEILDTPKGKRIQEYLVNQLQFAPRFDGDKLISIDIVR